MSRPGKYAHRVPAWRRDPRPSTVVARAEGCSPGLVRQARLGLIYRDLPWPKRIPDWQRGPAPGTPGNCHIGHLNPGAVLNAPAVVWLRRQRELHGTPYAELAEKVTERFNLPRMVTPEAICSACLGRSWSHV